MCLVTMSGPQADPSAAGMNLVSHFLPTRWHHRALQISWKREEARTKRELAATRRWSVFFFCAWQISKVGPIGISQQLQTKTPVMEIKAQWDNTANATTPPESCSNTSMKTYWNRPVPSNCVLAGRQLLRSRVRLKYLRFGSYGNVSKRRHVCLLQHLDMDVF